MESRQNPLLPFVWEHVGVIDSGELQVGPQAFPILSDTNTVGDDSPFLGEPGVFDTWSTGLLAASPTPQAAIACAFDTSFFVDPGLFVVPPFDTAALCQAVIRITSIAPGTDLLVAELTALVDDRDGDGVGDAIDVCPDWPDPDQLDADDNGIGNACECGDQDGNGILNVADILAINAVIFELQAASALCDANGDGECNVGDILAVNGALFGGPTSCARHPAP